MSFKAQFQRVILIPPEDFLDPQMSVNLDIPSLGMFPLSCH